MRIKWLVIMVAVAHCIAVGGVLLMPGCGMFRGPMLVSEPETPVMPPPEEAVETVPAPVAVSPLHLPESRSWPGQTSTYIVAKGDTLSGIAARFGLSVAELVALNNITDPNRIRAGRPLIVTGKPVDERTKPAGKKVAAPKPVAIPEGAVAHVVKSGETLSEIAAKYGIKTADLKQANGLTGDKIVVDQKLLIPGVKQTATSPPLPVSTAGSTMRESPQEAAFDIEEPPMSEPVESAAVEGAPVPSLPGPAAVSAPEATGAVRIYVVEEGEDLYSVAMKWAVSVARIKELNHLADSATLTPGTQLKIPISE